MVWPIWANERQWQIQTNSFSMQKLGRIQNVKAKYSWSWIHCFHDFDSVICFSLCDTSFFLIKSFYESGRSCEWIITICSPNFSLWILWIIKNYLTFDEWIYLLKKHLKIFQNKTLPCLNRKCVRIPSFSKGVNSSCFYGSLQMFVKSLRFLN